MKQEKKISYAKIPVLKIVIIIMVLISIIFQSIISYVDKETRFVAYLEDTLVTICAETIFSLYTYFWVSLFNKIFKNKWNWIRYPLEFAIVFTGCFFILYEIFIVLSGTTFSLDKLIRRGSFRLHITINMVAVVFIYALVTLLNFYQVIMEKTSAAAQLEKQNTQMRLQALKSQVNPHFLFNSLSVLSSLVRIDAVSSEKFIIQLSKAYRYILEQKNSQLVTLHEELEFLDAYFFLLQIRFENKVLMEKNIQVNAKEYFLPPLTLQLLVENVVKHNKMSVGNPLIIHLTATSDSITVKNNRNSRESKIESTGVGLSNIQSRIACLTDQKMIIQSTDDYFKVVVPLIKNIKIPA
jgi:two-component system, LytTR family, sensor kinase